MIPIGCRILSKHRLLRMTRQHTVGITKSTTEYFVGAFWYKCFSKYLTLFLQWNVESLPLKHFVFLLIAISSTVSVLMRFPPMQEKDPLRLPSGFFLLIDHLHRASIDLMPSSFVFYRVVDQ